MLKLENVSAGYGNVSVLRNVSLEIRRGELCCLLGSNGAGKTTTLKSILGLVRIVSGGRILLDGKPIHGLKTHQIVEAGIGVVPEGRRLFPRMTVLENLRMGAYTQRTCDDMDARLESVFQVFPRLKERLNQLAGTMSGGEQSMAAIGRGLMGRPKMLLMDEPSLGLAPKTVDEYFATIRRINEAGITILLIEQNARKALSVATKGYLLQKGQIAAQGTRAELRDSDIVKKAYF
jgi:branched-chain amino acid transport system ATP-binding protein